LIQTRAARWSRYIGFRGKKKKRGKKGKEGGCGAASKALSSIPYQAHNVDPIWLHSGKKKGRKEKGGGKGEQEATFPRTKDSVPCTFLFPAKEGGKKKKKKKKIKRGKEERVAANKTASAPEKTQLVVTPHLGKGKRKKGKYAVKRFFRVVSKRKKKGEGKM